MASPGILPPPVVPRRGLVTVTKIVRSEFIIKIVPSIEIELRADMDRVNQIIQPAVVTSATASSFSTYTVTAEPKLKGFWLYSEALRICEYVKAKPWSRDRSENDHVFRHLVEQKILMLWEYAKSHGLDRLDEIEGPIGTAVRFVALRAFEKPRSYDGGQPIDDEGKQL